MSHVGTVSFRNILGLLFTVYNQASLIIKTFILYGKLKCYFFFSFALSLQNKTYILSCYKHHQTSY